MKNKSILLTGKMGVGKSSVAGRIISMYQYNHLSMASWIKDTIANHYKLDSIDKSMIINDKPMRTILQQLGEFIKIIDPNWHIDEVLDKINTYKIKKFVIDDVRFKHEVNKLCKLHDCIVIKIVCNKNTRLERIILRDMIVPSESHLNNSSELEVDEIPYDYLIENNSDIQSLYEQVDYIMRSNI